MPRWNKWQIDDDDNVEYFQPIKKQKKVKDDGEEIKNPKKGRVNRRMPRPDKE